MALATFLIVLTYLFEPAVAAYKVAFRVCTQEKNPAGTKTVLRRSWRSSWISGCFGAFARAGDGG